MVLIISRLRRKQLLENEVRRKPGIAPEAPGTIAQFDHKSSPHHPWDLTRDGGATRVDLPLCPHAHLRALERGAPSRAAGGSLPMRGSAIGGAIGARPLSVTAGTSGRAMMTKRADMKCTVIPVQGPARRFGPICMPSMGSMRETCIAPWRRMKPWAIRNGSHPR